MSSVEQKIRLAVGSAAAAAAIFAPLNYKWKGVQPSLPTRFYPPSTKCPRSGDSSARRLRRTDQWEPLAVSSET